MGDGQIKFYFNGKELQGHEGDSIAKALFDAGVTTLSYSVKYKQARGVACARGRCIMCHMEIDGVPGIPTCITPLRAGMRVEREDFRPFFAPLLIAAARIISFPAGFYYRMFTKPAFIRQSFLGSLRRMAGVGRVTATPDPAPPISCAGRTPQKRYDTVVVGAGMSGMSAALQAAERGESVLLVDEYAAPGGHSIGYQSDPALADNRDRLCERLCANTAIDYCAMTTAQAFFAPDTLLLGAGGAIRFSDIPANAGNVSLGGKMRRVHASRFVFATGAYDLVPTFDNNDIPGIFGARSIRLLLERDGLRPGRRAVVYGCGDDVRETAALLGSHNIEVAAQLHADNPPAHRRATHGTLGGARVTRAHGHDWLQKITIQMPEGSTHIDCDMLVTAFRGQGAYELPYHAGIRFEMSPDEVSDNRVMQPTQRSIDTGNGTTCYIAGELAGVTQWRDKVDEAITNATPREPDIDVEDNSVSL